MEKSHLLNIISWKSYEQSQGLSEYPLKNLVKIELFKVNKLIFH